MDSDAARRERDAYRRGWFGAAYELAAPYPSEVFTPMTEEETKAAVAAMNAAVPFASERLHASWARHWSDVLLRMGEEIEP